jgi:iron complex transport system substrate-binding protein
MYVKILITQFFLFASLVLAKTPLVSSCNIANDTSDIVIAGGSITEILYFLDEEDRIRGVDVTSNFPKETNKLPSIGYVRSLSTEGILSLNPKLILGENDMGPPLVIDQIKEVGVDLRIIYEEQTAMGIIEKISCIASIIGIQDKAQEEIKNKLMPKLKDLKKFQDDKVFKKKRVMLILSMQGTSPIVAGAGTSGDGFIKMTGAVNVFESFKGWKPVSEEAIIASDPDYFIIPSRDMHKNSDVKSLTSNPIFKNTRAGSKENFIFEDSMAMLGFGPRTIMTALKVAKEIYQQD